MPGFRKGEAPVFKGLELPAEELPERDVAALLDSYGSKPKVPDLKRIKGGTGPARQCHTGSA